jgi:flagellar hook-basal body complex protein FliE
MEISSVGLASRTQSLLSPTQNANRPSAAGFAQALGDAMGQLNSLQNQSDQLSLQLAAGQPVDLHDVVIASEETNLAFQLAVQVRNKVVESYQEVMRMQV